MASPSKAIGLGTLLVVALASAQAQNQAPNAQPPVAQGLTTLRPDYELGPNDQILITVPEAPEINGRPFRIDSDGNIDLPLINRVHAAGLTVRGLENVVTTQLRDFVREPRVSITVTRSAASLFLHRSISRPNWNLSRFRVVEVWWKC